tara:strand:- start:87 stop:329 length:243 start_codon:yes stop_codon:yes gene_type:complete
MIVSELMKGLHHMGVKIPSDCWHLQDEYFSNSENEYLVIENMDIFHVLRAFAKQCRNEPDDVKQSLANLKQQISDLEMRI